MGIHDKRYKKIFSNPVVMERLLTSFVHEDFIAKLDFSNMQKIDKVEKYTFLSYWSFRVLLIS